jgi:hypothetical protein
MMPTWSDDRSAVEAELSPPTVLMAYLREGLTIQMQIDTHKGDPAEDRSAFIGGVLVCMALFAILLAAHVLL